VEVPGTYPDLQTALNAVAAGSTIRLVQSSTPYVGEFVVQRPVRIEAPSGATLTSSGGNERTLRVTAAAAGTVVVGLTLERTDDGSVVLAEGAVTLERCRLVGGVQDFGVKGGTGVALTLVSSSVEGSKTGLDSAGPVFIVNSFFRGGPGGGGSHAVRFAATTTGTFLHNTVLMTNEDGIECAGSAVVIDRSIVSRATRDQTTNCVLRGSMVFADPVHLGLQADGRAQAASIVLGAAGPRPDDPPEAAFDIDGAPRSATANTDVGADEITTGACGTDAGCRQCTANPCEHRVCTDSCTEVCPPETSCSLEANVSSPVTTTVRLVCAGAQSCDLDCNNATNVTCTMVCAAGADCAMDCNNVQNGSCVGICDETSTCVQTFGSNAPNRTFVCSSNGTTIENGQQCVP
jgi:hypothetical protein